MQKTQANVIQLVGAIILSRLVFLFLWTILLIYGNEEESSWRVYPLPA